MSDIENVEQFVGQLKVIELREELKKRHLPYTGNKKDLAQRLQDALTKEKEQQEEDGTEEKAEVEAEEEESADTAEEADEEEPAVSESKEEEEEEEEEAKPTEEVPSEDTPQENGEQDQIPRIVESTSTTMDDQPATDEPEQEEQEQEETKEDEPAAVVADGDQESMETGGDGGEDKKEDATETEQMEASAQEDDKEDAKPEDKKEEADTKEDTDVTEEGSGVKRQHEDEDTKGDKAEKVDPSKAPDPEEPEKFDESALKGDLEEQFKPPEDDVTITLDRYNSDLHFKMNSDGLGGCNLSDHGFAYLWAAARATWGVKGGKYFYEVRVEENLEVDLPDTEEHPHAVRVGWSPDEGELSLGEVPHSFGYGGTGKSSTNRKFETYGEPYGPGDVIGCFLDLESSPRTISYSKNGQHLGTAFTLEEDELKDKALFPHVATKNVKLSVNFSSPAWSEVEGVEGYLQLQDATEEHKMRAVKGPTSASECEVLMMIGLPASGKTTWAEKYCRDHPDSRFNILGTNLIMDKMKVSGLAKKQNYHGRWEALIKQSTEVLNAMFMLAGKNNRNYIIDQTNVYDGAQRRKMSYFEGFTKKAVVVVPPHHVLRQRTSKRNTEMGQPVPEDAINAMKANFHVPRKGGIFEDVLYAEIYGVAADKIVRQYREDALGLPSYPTSKRGRYDRGPGGGGGGRFSGPPRSGGRGGGGGYPPYPPYGRGPPYGSYGYSRSPGYPPYRHPPPPPHHMYPPRGGYGGGHGPYHHSPYPPRPYGGRGGYGPPPHHRGGGYYGRY